MLTEGMAKRDSSCDNKEDVAGSAAEMTLESKFECGIFRQDYLDPVTLERHRIFYHPDSESVNENGDDIGYGD